MSVCFPLDVWHAEWLAAAGRQPKHLQYPLAGNTVFLHSVETRHVAVAVG